MIGYNGIAVSRNDAIDPMTSKVDLNASIGTLVTVRVASIPPGTGATANLFDVNDAPIANPVTSDDNGNYFFKIDAGTYDIISKEGDADEFIEPSQTLGVTAELINDLSQAYKVDSLSVIGTLILPVDKLITVSGAINHERLVSVSNDGTGELLSNGLYANLILSVDGVLKTSDLGWVADTDYTTEINALVTYLTNNDVRKFKFDTGNVIFNGTLPEIFGRITFSGDGELQVNTRDNLLQRLSAERTTSKQYHGNLNKGPIYNQAFKTAVFSKRDVRVVLLGDSIFVGPDFDSGSVTSTGFVNTIGVDNIDRHNCVSTQIYLELLSMMPSGTRLKFYSRSIAGQTYTSLPLAWDSVGGLFDDREEATPGKTWIDCVIDLEPDLVIHGMGMNQNASSYVNDFFNEWFSPLHNNLLRNTFDQMCITTPNPNFRDAGGPGDFRDWALNADKFYVASNQRDFSNRYNMTLADVAFASMLKRYGVDNRSCTFTKDATVMTFPDSSTSKTIRPGENSGEFTPSDYPIYHSTKFKINPSVDSDTAGFEFRLFGGGTAIYFLGGNMTVFSGAYPSSIGDVSSTVPYLMLAGVDYELTFTVTPSGVYVYEEDELVCSVVSPLYSATLPLIFYNQASSADVTVVSGETRSPQFARYMADTASDGELYGKLDFTQNEFGGGINHPSSVGIEEIYMPPIRDAFTSMLHSTYFTNTVLAPNVADSNMVFIGRIAAIDYSKVTLSDYGSSIDLQIQIRIIAGVTSYVVLKNANTPTIDFYLDDDLALFLINTSSFIAQLDYTGEWLSKAPLNFGVRAARGALLPQVP